ncbi:MAG: DEAD/DEAH box helicase [Bacteroidia bacterium]|nr:DEAD/DEAH box helicase [Bacteroidia bacterium]
MISFHDLKISTPLLNAMDELGFVHPTPVQEESFPVIMSGRNVIGIAQTGTGKTLAYMLPLLQEHKFSKDPNPRVLILVPTRELVLQVVEEIEKFAKYIHLRVIGVYGGANINAQKLALSEGCDIVVATPGRLYDLALARAVQLKGIKKLVIDEVDVMLDLGFRFQLTNIFELLPEKRQNIMFSATMTEEIDDLIDDFFIAPARISIAVSGTPLENITQSCYPVPNFNTKVNLLSHLVWNRKKFSKVLIFVSTKRMADRLFRVMQDGFGQELGIIHSNKSQNSRIQAIQDFDAGKTRILIATDVMARGLDLEKITHVINFDTPSFPENYMHRIGRTGRAEESGTAILFFTEKEEPAKRAIEALMNYEIPQVELPEEVEISQQLIPEERPESELDQNTIKGAGKIERGQAFHEKKEKNKKVNVRKDRAAEASKKYNKPKTRGDKKLNQRKKRR